MIKRILSATLFAALFLVSCSSTPSQPPVANQITIQPATSSPGFNVQNFSIVVKQTTDPSALEKAINAPNNTVNNLDLNGDGQVDFVAVNESAGQIIVIDNDVNPAVTVCTLTINQTGSQAIMNINGSPNYCGPDYSYHSSFGLSDFLFLHYVLHPHPYYYPHYAYGYHPAYYHSYRYAPYRTVTRTSIYRSSPLYRSSGGYRSTSSYRTSAPARSSISAPVRSQRSFSTTSNSGGFRSSGFGRSSSSSSFGSSSRSSSFGSSSRSSFGGSSSRSFSSGRR